jgi:hypothetical protein
LHRHDGAAAVNEEAPGSIEFLQDKTLAAEEARANLARERDG